MTEQDKAQPVSSVLKAVASKDLDEKVKAELEIEDPEDKEAIASLLHKKAMSEPAPSEVDHD
jgi:hypothetical protein